MIPLSLDRLDGVLALNNAHAAELSLLDAPRLAALVRQAFWAARVGEADAFVLTLDQSADYDSPNFGWFRSRFGRFVYVDRIAVAPAARGRGLARLLHAGVLRAAAAAGHTTIAAEVNLDPPNPASDALHAALGFQEVGQASIHGGAKTVRYMARTIAADDPGLQASQSPFQPPSWPGLTRPPTPCRQGGTHAPAAGQLQSSACPIQQSGPRDGVDGRIKSGHDATRDAIGIGRDEDLDARTIAAVPTIQAVS